MTRGYFVTGTDTGVGKTLVASALVHGFAEQGLRSAGMKPVVSGAVVSGGECRWEDTDSLRRYSNVDAPLDWVSPYRFVPPVAPHVAAGEAGGAIELGRIRDAFNALSAHADVTVVEGVGGFLVPLNKAETTADLAVMLGLPVVLVVGMRLGCINHALLTQEAIKSRGLAMAGWVANQIDPAMARYAENIGTLQALMDAEFIGEVPFLANALDVRGVSGRLANLRLLE